MRSEVVLLTVGAGMGQFGYSRLFHENTTYIYIKVPLLDSVKTKNKSLKNKDTATEHICTTLSGELSVSNLC